MFYETQILRCEELRPCVECKAYKSESDCDAKCADFPVKLVEKIEEDDAIEGTKTCRAPDDSGCTIIFEYFYDYKNQLVIRAQKDKICSEIANVWGKSKVSFF